MIGQTAYRSKTGVYGAFVVRNPLGKGLGFLLALVLLAGCWQWSRHRAGPVGWADKALYMRTGWDAAVDPMLSAIPVLHLGQAERYPVIVERAAGWPLYTNEAHAAGKAWTVQPSDVPAKLLHRLLALYVYGGNFWRKVWPLWLLWPVLLVCSLIAGQLVDMRRLRRARQSGVHLRGNRMVEAAEWNRRANEETA
jgi:hypothetical protein